MRTCGEQVRHERSCPPMTCSKLSRSSKKCCSRRNAITCSEISSSEGSWSPSARAITFGRSCASRRAASETNTTPWAKCASRSLATATRAGFCRCHRSGKCQQTYFIAPEPGQSAHHVRSRPINAVGGSGRRDGEGVKAVAAVISGRAIVRNRARCCEVTFRAVVGSSKVS